MKHRKIKTFESFSIGAAAGVGITLYAVNYLIKTLAKNSKNRFDRNTLLEFLRDDLHSKAIHGWNIKEYGDTIEIVEKDMPNTTSSKKTHFKVHKSENRLEYISDTIPMNQKLPKKEIDRIIDGINFVKKNDR